MSRVTEAHLEARRNQILDAAWQCFAERGYHDTTMQDIATAAGLSAGAIYRYFPGKVELLKAMSDRSMEHDQVLVDGARNAAGEPLAALELLSVAMRAYMADPGFETAARVTLELRPEYLRNPALKEAAGKNLRATVEAFTKLIGEAEDQGYLKPGVDPRALAVLSMSLNEGLRQLRLIDPVTFAPEQCINLLRHLLVEPRGPAGSPPRRAVSRAQRS